MPRGAFQEQMLRGGPGRVLAIVLNQGAEGLQKFSGLTPQAVSQANELQRQIDKLSA